MPTTTNGVSGRVQYDADVTCFSDAHEEGEIMMATEEQSDRGNDILECPECGVRRAVNLRVVPVARIEPDD